MNGWKLSCGCWVDTFKVIRSCAKCQREFDETRAEWIRDKAILTKWNEDLLAEGAGSRSGTCEHLGGPVTWAAPKPAPKSSEDLTSLMS